MSPAVVRKRLAETPFRPFELWLNSGQIVRVLHPDFALMPPKPNDWDIVVYDEEQAFSIVDLAHVAALTDCPRGKRNGRGSARK